MKTTPIARAVPPGFALPLPGYAPSKGEVDWVKEHVLDVLGRDLSEDELRAIVTTKNMIPDLALLGVESVPYRLAGGAGLLTAAKKTTGVVVSAEGPVVRIDRLGFTHGRLGVVREDGSVDRAVLNDLLALARPISAADGRAVTAIDRESVRRFIASRFAFSWSKDESIAANLLRLVRQKAALHLYEAVEWSLLFDIAGTELDKRPVLLPEDIEDFYQNRLFTRVRAERAAVALIDAGKEPVKTGSNRHDAGKMAQQLVTYAKRFGLSHGTPADIAARLVEGMSLEQRENRARDRSIGLLARNVFLLACPFARTIPSVSAAKQPI
jgi:hypothetical protein